MRSAPSVSYPVGPSRIARGLFLSAWLAGAAGIAAWFARVDAGAGALSLAAGLLAVSGAAAWRGFRAANAAARTLAWDGRHWAVVDATGGVVLGAARVFVHLDLQSLMLLRLVESGRPACWLWLERRALPPRWLALRRAVHGRPPAAAATDFAALS